MGRMQQNAINKAADIRNSNLQKKKFIDYPLPPFDLGIDYLGVSKLDNSFGENQLQQYIDEWFRGPERYLRPSKMANTQIKEKGGFLVFPSLLDNSQSAKFKYDSQPKGTPGRKVALIHVMHWNGRLKPYNRIVSLIRNTALPISTLIHIPAGRGLNPGDGDPADYDSVSPNIGKTIFRARQDIQDLQFIARYLKERMGYDQVGLITYSIGSLRGIIASVMSPGLFDFGIFHMVSDDFTEAVMKGVATTDIADKINGNIDYQSLQKLWTTISPGSYSKYFPFLPKNTRIVQCEYDFVFGLENVKKFDDKVMELGLGIDLEIAPLSHTTLGNFPTGWEIMWNNLRYIYKYTHMNQYKRAALFIDK